MPNHVTTKCTVTGDKKELERFSNTFFSTGENGEFNVDFNRIIPMPEILLKTIEGSVSIMGEGLIRLANGDSKAAELFTEAQIKTIRKEVKMPLILIDEVAKAYLKLHPEYEREGSLRIQAITETGYASWYPWSVEKWGTKWNAYDSYLNFYGETLIEFRINTAWSFPEAVFQKLAELFPDLTFHCECFDEGWMFAGMGHFNPEEGGIKFQFVDADEELFERVYGYKYVPSEDDMPL